MLSSPFLIYSEKEKGIETRKKGESEEGSESWIAKTFEGTSSSIE